MAADDRWLTPDDLPEGVTCRPLLIPDQEQIIAAIAGALLPLTYENNWQLFGAVTPAEIAVAMKTMFEQAFVEPCGVTMEVDIFSHQVAQDVDGGGIGANTKTYVPYNTSNALNVGNVTISANDFSVAPGKYLIECEHWVRADAAYGFICWLENSNSLAILAEGLHSTEPLNVHATARITTMLSFSETTLIGFMGQSTDARATDFFGLARNVAGHVEVYGFAKFTRLGEPV